MDLRPLLPKWHTPPPTPTPLAQKSSSIEFAEYANHYERLYREIQRLITKICKTKLYSCDEYEVHSGFIYGSWVEDLDDDKLLLALNAAVLEEVRVDVLQ